MKHNCGFGECNSVWGVLSKLRNLALHWFVLTNSSGLHTWNVCTIRIKIFFFFFWVSISKQMQGKMVTNSLAIWDLLLFNSKEAILPQKHTEIIKKLGLLSNLLPAKMHFFLALPLSLPPPFAKWITGKQLYHMNDRILNHGILSWFGNAIW